MDIRKLTGSQYLAAVEFNGAEPTFTISDAKLEDFESDDNGVKKVERKGVVSFAETPRKWVINVTNAQLIAAMFGRETKGWQGKKVTLFAAASKAALAIGGVAIRVRGSPDIPGSIQATVRLARKKPQEFTLQKTGGK